jgi:hypothetical protein
VSYRISMNSVNNLVQQNHNIGFSMLFSFSNGQCNVQLAVLLLISTLIFASSEAKAKDSKNDMINGTWIIEATPPVNAVKLCDEYLPTSTRIRFQILGPTRLAVEEERTDELGGTVELIPPISAALCSVGLGQSTEFGSNLCSNGQPIVDDKKTVQFDADFTFFRLTNADLEDVDNLFFSEQGAHEGAKMVTVSVNYKAVQWNIWMRSINEMISECLVVLPGKNNVDSFPMIWRRQH